MGAIDGAETDHGFLASAKVRPTKKLVDLPVESVVMKLKDKAFARSVDRSYVYGGGYCRPSS